MPVTLSDDEILNLDGCLRLLDNLMGPYISPLSEHHRKVSAVFTRIEEILQIRETLFRCYKFKDGEMQRVVQTEGNTNA